MKTIKILGLRRSGNHIITNWLIQHLSLKYNIIYKNNMQYIDNKPVTTEDDRYINNNRLDTMCVMTFEDYSIDEYNRMKLPEGPNILIIRDAYNLFASRIKNSLVGMDRIIVGKWKTHIKYSQNPTKSHICINYNFWCTDEDYKKSIIRQLGLEYIKDFKNIVPKFGGGSSFDGLNYKDNPSLMNVLERYKVYKGQRVFNKYIDREVREYCSKYFNITLN